MSLTDEFIEAVELRMERLSLQYLSDQELNELGTLYALSKISKAMDKLLELAEERE